MKKIILFSLLFALFCHTNLTAQTHIWTGNGGDNDWFNASNWNVNSVPDAASNALISTSNSVVEINSGTAISNFVTVHNGASLTLDANLTVAGSITVDNNSVMRWKSGTISGGGSIENTSLFIMEDPTTKMMDGITFNNGGELRISQSNQIQVLNTTINNEAGALLDIASVGGFLQQSTNSVLNNAGVLRKNPDGVNPIGNFYMVLEVNNTGEIQIPEDEILLFLAGSSNFVNEGTIVGEGTMDITANFINSGITIPGDGDGFIGTLHFVNNFNLNGGTIHVNIGLDGNEFDKIDITGTTNLEGTIMVELESDLAIGQQFEILTASLGVNTCSFPQFVYADTFGGTLYEFEVLCLPNSVVLNVSDILLGVDGFNDEIEFYAIPNPSSGETLFKLPSEVLLNHQNITLSIYTLQGQLVRKITVANDTLSADFSNLVTGLYIVQLESDVGIIATEKLIVE